MRLLAVAAGLGICAVATCALSSPGLVFGAGQSGPVLEAAARGVREAVEATPAAGTVLATGAAEAGGVPVEAAATIAPSKGSLLVALPWGSGEGEVGLSRATEGLTEGPEAIAAAPDGRIAVLDSVNGRMVTLDPSGGFLAAFAVDLAEPRFLAVTDKNLYVLDCDSDKQLLSFEWDGAILGRSAMPELDDVVTGLFATEAGPCIETGHSQSFLVPQTVALGDSLLGSSPDSESVRAALRSLPGRPIDGRLDAVATVTFKSRGNARVRLFDVDHRSLTTREAADFTSSPGPRVADHLVSVDGDGDGGLIIGARLLAAGSVTAKTASLVINHVERHATLSSAAQAAAPTGTLYLDDSTFAYVGQPYVVTPDGRVLQPVADEAYYSIIKYGFPPAIEVTP